MNNTKNVENRSIKSEIGGKTRKTLFSFRLFMENFKGLKLPGIICIILCCGFLWLHLSTEMEWALNATNYYETDRYMSYRSYVYLNGYYGMMMLVAIGMGILLTLMAFQFQNKKNSSDFYNALPFTRTDMYLTKMAAVLSWTVLNVILMTVIMIGYRVHYPDIVVCQVSELFWCVLSSLIASFFFQTILGLACAMTGNLVGNVWFAAIIICAPTTLYILADSIVEWRCPYMIELSVVSWIFTHLSIAGQLFSDSTWYLFPVATLLLTFVKGVLVLLLGVYLYKKRKAEAAENVSNYSWLVTVLRSLVGCIIFELALIVMFVGNEKFYGGFIICVGIIAMVVYEFISGDRFNRVRKTLISTGLALVVSTLFFLICLGAGNVAKAYRPSERDIEYITIEYDGFNMGAFSTYHADQLKQVKIRDELIIQQVASMYENSLKELKEQELTGSVYIVDTTYEDLTMEEYGVAYEEPFPTDTQYTLSKYGNYPSILNVTFHEKGRDVKRIVYTRNSGEFGQLVQYFDQSDEVRNALLKLPSYEEVVGDTMLFSEKNGRKMYETICEDVQNMGLFNYIKATGEARFYGETSVVHVIVKETGRSIEFPLADKSFEKSRKMMMELSNKAFMEETQQGEKTLEYADIYGYNIYCQNPNQGDSVYMDQMILDEELVALLQKNATKTVDLNKKVYVVNLYLGSREVNFYFNYEE